MSKLLLVHPLFLAKSPEERAAASPYFPLGLLYLAAYVREQGHDVAVFDATFEEDETAFDRILEQEKPDIVGISALLTTRDSALELGARAQRVGCPVIVGGPDPTASPELYLTDAAVDIVVHHEGEQTISSLLDRLDRGNLTVESLADEPGVAFRANGSVQVNQPRPPIENLDELPMPARDLVDMHRYLQTWEETNGYSSMTIATARGCPYNCRWCADAVHGNEFRQRSPQSVAAEMKELKDTYDIERLRMVDDVDAISREWLDQWAGAAQALDAEIPFEALNDLERQDIPLLDVRDSL